MISDLKSGIVAAIEATQDEDSPDRATAVLRPYVPRDRWPENQALLFLKPEATAIRDGVDARGVLDVVFERMKQFGIELGAMRIVGSAALRSSGVIERHYGVINRIAHEGRAALSGEAESALVDIIGSTGDSQMPVLGGFQVLERYSDCNPPALEGLVDAAGSTRLASGTYCSDVTLDGTQMLVLNGFHPAQVEYYTQPGRSLVVWEALTDLAWRRLRNDFTGATDPAKAAAGSVRADLRASATKLGLGTVDQARNCFHCSAGPIEGLAELVRFLEVDESETRAGSAILAAGFTASELEEFTGNAVVDGHGLTAYDATEELDTSAAVQALREARAARG